MKAGAMMLIDGHAHMCGELHDLNGIFRYMADYTLDKIVLCPGEHNNKRNRKMPMLSSYFDSSNIGYALNRVIHLATSLTGAAKYIDEQNQIIAGHARHYPDRIVQAYWVNPFAPDCMEKIEQDYAVLPFGMLKLHQCWTRFDLNDPKIIEIIEWTSGNSLPIFIHLFSKEQSIKMAHIAKAYSDVNFIIGHMIGFDEIISVYKGENVFFDISGAFLLPFSKLELSVHRLGSTRFILGSDTPFGGDSLRLNLERIEKLKITSREKENIYGQNLLGVMQQTQSVH